MERKYYLDYLRIAASMAVVLLHCASGSWLIEPVNSFNWQVLNFYDSITRWGVPIFLMISGSIFLTKNISIKDLFCKYIFKLALVYAVWSLFYVFSCTGFSNIKVLIVETITGYYHMWYLLAAIGMYLCTPIINKINENKDIEEYTIIILIVFSFIIPALVNILEIFGLPTFVSQIYYLQITKIPGLFVYYILGHYISSYTLKFKKQIYILGLIGLIITIVGTSVLSMHFNTPNELFYSSSSLNILAMSVAIFAYGIGYDNEPKNKRLLTTLSKATLGVYLVHPFVLKVLKNFGFTSISFNPILVTPLLFVSTYGISLIISLILNKIPFIKDYLV